MLLCFQPTHAVDQALLELMSEDTQQESAPETMGQLSAASLCPADSSKSAERAGDDDETQAAHEFVESSMDFTCAGTPDSDEMLGAASEGEMSQNDVKHEDENDEDLRDDNREVWGLGFRIELWSGLFMFWGFSVYRA